MLLRKHGEMNERTFLSNLRTGLYSDMKGKESATAIQRTSGGVNRKSVTLILFYAK